MPRSHTDAEERPFISTHDVATVRMVAKRRGCDLVISTRTARPTLQVETASESSTPRGAWESPAGEPAAGRAPFAQQRPVDSAPAWLSNWRLKLALSSQVSPMLGLPSAQRRACTTMASAHVLTDETGTIDRSAYSAQACRRVR